MAMQIYGLGIDYSTGRPLLPSMTEEGFGEAIANALHGNYQETSRLRSATKAGEVFRGEMEREPSVDLGDPRRAGWTFLLNSREPYYRDIVDILRPLAEHRQMADPLRPLQFHDEPTDAWPDWLLQNYTTLEGQTPPHYVLLVGGPEKIPFHFQSFLQSAAAVGRLDADSLDDLRNYVAKILRLEKADAPVVERDAVFFATDHGSQDPTYFSHRYMALPIADETQGILGGCVRRVMGPQANKSCLLEALRGRRPALVYTASHGLGAPRESLDVQKRFQGAICCEHAAGTPVADWVMAAADVPRDEPFLEGAVFWQFACFGYGTPRESDFMHWLRKPELNSQADFVAALPKALLAHPRGPIAFIGHVDTAWLHGITDPEDPYIIDRWHPRIEPFVFSIRTLLRVQPVARAMANMNKRYDIGNAQLTNTFDRLERGTLQLTSESKARLANAFISRSDAQNYMVFGDPAVRLRIPTA